ncbi:MAG: hypothetical protein ACFFCW_06910 [Candidatus Hodarchaeota archaeon]
MQTLQSLIALSVANELTLGGSRWDMEGDWEKGRKEFKKVACPLFPKEVRECYEEALEFVEGAENLIGKQLGKR